VGKIAKKKNRLKECDFVNSALKIQCHVQTAFSAILPNGLGVLFQND